MPKISVVMASYNHEKFVAETIQSVLDQTFDDFEFIITDDGSSDGTADIIKSFSDQRIKFFEFPENRGACIAMNNCIEHSNCEYIAVINSDDVWMLDKLEKQYKFLEENPKYGAVFSYAETIDEKGNYVTSNSRIFKRKQNLNRYQFLNIFFTTGFNQLIHPTLMIRKSCYQNIGLYKPSLIQTPDFDLWIRLTMRYEIFILNENLIKFRIMSDNSNVSAGTIDVHNRTIIEYINLLENYLEINSIKDFLLIFPEIKDDVIGELNKDYIPIYLAMLSLKVKRYEQAYKIFALNIFNRYLSDTKIYDYVLKHTNLTPEILKQIKTIDLFNIKTTKEYKEVIHKLNNPYFSELYIDTGLGFNPKQRLSKNITGNETLIEFDVESLDYKNRIRQLRIDPINVFSSIFIKDIKFVTKDDKEVLIEEYTTNAFYKDEDSLIFDNTDPQILIKNEYGEIKKILIQLDFIAIGNGVINKINSIKNTEKLEQIRQKDNLINEKQQQIKEKDRIINEKTSQLKHKDMVVSEKEIEIEQKGLVISERDKEIENTNNLLSEKTHLLEKKDKELDNKNKIISDKSKQLNEKAKLITNLQHDRKKREELLNEKNSEINRLNDRMIELRNAYDIIKNSKSYKIVKKLGSFFPPNSLRRKILKFGYKVALSIYKLPRNIKAKLKESKVKKKNIVKQFDHNYKSQIIPEMLNQNVSDRQKQLRIAYVLWNYPGMSETFIINELRWLVNNRFDVKIYFLKQPPVKGELDFDIESYQFKDVDELVNMLKSDNRNIMHTHFAYPTTTELLYPTAQKTGISFTFIAHAVDIFLHLNDRRNRIDEVTKSPYCLKVFAPGSFHREYFISRGVPEEKIVNTSQTVEFNFYQNIDYKDRLYTKNKTIFTIARFIEKKGISYLIKAMKNLPDIQLHIYGYGDLEEEYKKIIRDENLTNVKIMGAIEGRDNLRKVYAEHDMLVAPSVRAENGDMDGIPTTLMEAMACGVPVLTTNVSSIGDLVKDNITGFLTKPRDEKALTDRIKQVYSLSPQKLEVIVDNAREKVFENYNIDDIMKKTVRIWGHDAVDMFLVTYNNLPELKEIIRRIYKYTTTYFNLTIVDNNSNRDVKKYLTSLAKVTGNVDLNLLKKNVFCGPGSNIALQKSKGKYAIYVCSKEGFILNYNWESEMIKYMERHQDVGIASHLAYHPVYPTGEKMKTHELFKHFRNKDYADRIDDKPLKHVQGGLYILRREMFEAIGGFNNKVYQASMDIEYSYYAESMGWKLGDIPNVYALAFKTRPDLNAYIDEDTLVVHPLMLGNYKHFEKIVSNSIKKCNICQWSGNRFTEYEECPNCGATGMHRTLFRYLAPSNIIYRKFRCGDFNRIEKHVPLFRKMFDYHIIDRNMVLDGKLSYDDREFNIIMLSDNINRYTEDVEKTKGLFNDIYRVLKIDGTAIIQFAYDKLGLKSNEIVDMLNEIGFNAEKINYKSNVIRYNPLYTFICRKREGNQ